MQTFQNTITLLKSAEALTAVLAMLAAVFAGIAAWLSYRLAKSIRDELKSDEMLVMGTLDHPSLSHPDHENCVLQTVVFNKSKRKCVISQLKVFDGRGTEIDVDWSSAIDTLGNPQSPADILGVVDSSPLCIRRRDGLAFVEAVVQVTHSFEDRPLVLTYSMEPGWQQYFAKV